MTPVAKEYAVLAIDSYEDRSKDVGDIVALKGVSYIILDAANRSSGYQATAYQRIDTGEVIIAHRGTESLQDGITDLGMALHGRNNQFDDAIAFTQRAIDLARSTQSNYPDPIAISMTGHSLGGTLAELTAAKFNLPAETFNAYGPADLKDLQRYGIDVHVKRPDIVNHLRATDVVGAGGRHLGEVVTYATAQDVESLRKGRYLDAQGLLRLPTNPLLTADLSAHKMASFVPDDVTGASVITPENETRARTYQGPIAQYRQDVSNSRIDLATIAKRAPSPLNMINPLDPSAKLRLQAMDAGAVATAGMVVEGMERVGRAAVQGIKDVGDKASRAYGSVFGSAAAPSTLRPQLHEAGHGDHELFKQALAGVHRLDSERGRTPDVHSDHLAASLVVAARRDGLSRIDNVVLSDDASKALAVQGAPRSTAMKLTSVPVVEAINTPIAQSTRALEQLIHHMAVPQRDAHEQQVGRNPTLPMTL